MGDPVAEVIDDVKTCADADHIVVVTFNLSPDVLRFGAFGNLIELQEVLARRGELSVPFLFS